MVSGLRQDLREVTDQRLHPVIPTNRIVAGLFLTVAAHIGSLNGMEGAMGAKGSRWHDWIGGDLPSTDRLGGVAALLDLDGLRAALVNYHRRRKRKKTMPALPGGLRVHVFDGHEMWASYRRTCPGVLSRQVECNNEVRSVGNYLR